MDNYYKTIIEKINDGVVMIKNGKIVYANVYAEKSLGYNSGDIVDSNFLEFVDSRSKKEVAENYKKTIAGEETYTYEAELIKKDGSLMPTEIHAQLVSYNGESVVAAIIRNIEARKKAEEIFHLQEERFFAVTENTPDIIARFDEECRYVYVNRSAEKEFGIPKKDFFWKNDKDLGIGNKRSAAFREAILSVFKTKQKKTFYSEVEDSGEKKYYYTFLIPEFFKDGTVNSVLSITRDITEISEIDKIKAEFISITTHQLRSPLSIISWCSKSLLRGDAGEVKREQEDYLEKIYSSTRELIKITDSFLNTTMFDLDMFVFDFSDIDIIDISKKMVEEFSSKLEKRKLNTNFIDFSNGLIIKTDPRILKIILRGLISNAIEYTGDEGNIDFLIKKEDDRKMIMEIGDDGCGISKEDQKKIFKKFYRAENAKNLKAHGTGLDLYLIRSILSRLGGSINMKSPNSKFGKGTVFFVNLPLLKE